MLGKQREEGEKKNQKGKIFCFLPEICLDSFTFNEVRKVSLEDDVWYLGEGSALDFSSEKQDYIHCQYKNMSRFAIGNK